MGRSQDFLNKYGALAKSMYMWKKASIEKQDKPNPYLAKYKEEERQRKEDEARLSTIVSEDNRLRKYQQQAVKNILEAWGVNEKKVMLQMPTGTGKTRLFVALINALNETKAEAFGIESKPKFLIVTHREELVEQISDTLISHYRLEHRLLGKKRLVTLSDCDNNNSLQRDAKDYICISSIQYLSRQLKDKTSELYNIKFDFIIIDEAHHSLAESYVLLWQAYPNAFKLGVTATPYRLKGNGFKRLYDKLIESQKMSEFIEQGFLADYHFYTVSSKQVALQKVNRLTKANISGDYQTKDLQKIYANDEEIAFLYDCYKSYADGKKGIIYAVNQFHAEMIAGYFLDCGVSIANLGSKTAKGKRKELITRFRKGELQILVNVELFGEGFDCPSIEFAMLARPTRSLTMYLQQVGRALRPTEDRGKVLILDCVGLYNRFGLPEDKRNWHYFFAREQKADNEFDKRLGINEKIDKMVEIETPRILSARATLAVKRETELEVFCVRDGKLGIRNGNDVIVVRPLYKELTKTETGWFYGKDDNKNTVIFAENGDMVFQRKDCDLVIRDDGRFMIGLTSADGNTFEIGPYDHRMCIEPKFIQAFNVSYQDRVNEYHFSHKKMYYQRDNLIVMTSYKLSLDLRLFRKTAMIGARELIVLLDFFDMKPYTLSPEGKFMPIRLDRCEMAKVMEERSLWENYGFALMGR